MIKLPSIQDFVSGEIKSLGWGVLSWCSTYLGQPDGKYKGERWRFTNEQALFILRYYAVDEFGVFLFNRAILERPKGWGKSPVLAALCCAELLGPVRFSHFDHRGWPVGREEYTPLIQIAAISEDQANNTYFLVMEMLKTGDAYDAYHLDGCIMLSKVHTFDGGIIQKVTASPKGREGQRVTFVVCDETHHWTPSEHGPELYAALKRNSVKMDNRIVETTNAPVPGEESVAEASYLAVLKQQEDWDNTPEELIYLRPQYIKILLDTRDVNDIGGITDIYNKDRAFECLKYVYGDSCIENGGWLNLERVWEDIIDPSTPEQEARRFYFNQKVQGMSAWLKEATWGKCRDKDIKLKKYDKISLGFRGNLRESATLVACRLTDGALFLVKNWEKPERAPADWEVSFAEVDAVIRKTLNRYDVYKFCAHPGNWQDIFGRISADYPDSLLEKPLLEEFWISNKTKMSRATEQFETAVEAKRLKWSDKTLSRHVLNCHTEITPHGHVPRRETRHSDRYISGAEASIIALEAAVLAIEEGALGEDIDNTLHGW